MNLDQLVDCLDNPLDAKPWLAQLNVRDAQRGHANLMSIAESGVPLELMVVLAQQLEEHLPSVSDPDRALNSFERFFSASRSPLGLASLLERDPDALPILLQIFSASAYLTDIMVRDPESYDLLRITEGQPISREVLVNELCTEVDALSDEALVMADLRRYKQRETLRIAYGDLIRGQHISTVTRQISFLADAICEAALRFARKALELKRGVPRRADGQPARFVVLALGKLGGQELNYSSDIDLVLVYDEDGQTEGPKAVENREFFDRLAKNFVKLLTTSTDLGVTYRVDLRLRPDGGQGPIVISRDSALRYYDNYGRTWERQAFMKARPIAGDIDLGEELLRQLEPWIYRRYLSRADITGVKAVKRRIEQRASREGDDHRNIKTGHGGIRDIEFVIQFLQLLNGADLPDTRTGNTLAAIVALEACGCLTHQERLILEENYAFLRKVEHRLQMMFDLQTHDLPDDPEEMRKLAIRIGYKQGPHRSPLEAFQADLESKTTLNRQILDHLLHDAFSDEQPAAPEVDLILDPDPSQADIAQVLGRYGFQNVTSAYQNLMALATEKIPFLSTRRCRMFLAAIAPHLLEAIAKTPDPDSTLTNLSNVSDSLGGKGVLWELFSFNPPTLMLYVRLCAAAPYLAGILTSSPGMIDELMDSLVMDKLPGYDWLDRTLSELCRGAEDLEPILHSFKNAEHLRVGVRDILGKEDIRDTHRALSDLAEVCLKQIAQSEYNKLVEKHGHPTIGAGERAGERCEMILLALGKLGGREPNYHSDLDVVFLYEAEGKTEHRRPDRSTTNQHFFSQLAQRIIKVVSQLGPFGRLYEIDARLRPTGKSGALALSLPEFQRYFDSGTGALWERQALCKARTLYGSAASQQRVLEVVREILTARPWQKEYAGEIYQMRQRLEETASHWNIKRGAGGTIDIEFAVQMLQLRHAAETPGVVLPGTLSAIAALSEAGYLDPLDGAALAEAYRFLRNLEAHLRLMNTTARHDLPESPADQKKLAFLLGYPSPEQLLAAVDRHKTETRRRFERIFALQR
ncbi:bifunctional [glutamate--ammonia ligase]-adenylyl-L-tyrosine phosphorylase/[glutamate--ammonia-ligase] adenylyltransferase [Lignipirellula cremea]|uniref:Glutamate-ammonia-ligase adenylyltransferase n=1 Tax=Lignipirellula cremea TaxID=2528010 RepID=A0A518DU09_9BACT|nr:bifunctional [glutamate--ammonia ligase]-adenylyl-L-tyrosine phosphorylase/[glutamate--ammonia-ligase] adenylyltransferase [Lignipirellula cremea]QDU95309.1 Glutamate-ammonia-ligase adenylyltransferase [Lignipirellula cremea]